MKIELQSLKRLHTRVSSKLATAALVPFVALMSSPAMAALPVMPTPEAIGGGTVAEGDWLGAMGGWFKLGLGILGLVLAGLGFMYVVMGALQKWKMYSAGRAEIGDLKEYFIMGAVFAVFLVVMVTYSAKVFQ
jgi:hypothetical protein